MFLNVKGFLLKDQVRFVLERQKQKKKHFYGISVMNKDIAMLSASYMKFIGTSGMLGEKWFHFEMVGFRNKVQNWKSWQESTFFLMFLIIPFKGKVRTCLQFYETN